MTNNEKGWIVQLMRLSEAFREFLEDKDTSNTLHNLLSVMQSKSFALALLVLLLPSALPLPTGGLSHIFEMVAIVIAFQLMLGKQYFWLPQNIMHYELKWASRPEFVKTLSGFLARLEKYAKQRWPAFINNRIVLHVSGFFFLVFSLGAFVAPWFSGLDTLPSLGVVLVAIALLLEDTVVLCVGVLIGLLGCVTVAAVYICGFNILGELWNYVSSLIG